MDEISKAGRKKASDFPQELLDLLDSYVHGAIGRREFIAGAGKFATAAVSAAALVEMLRPNYAWAIQVPEDDKRLKTESVTVPSPAGNGHIDCYLVRPAAARGKLPGIIVIHENRGLNPYIKDVARRLAVAGYMALAPDGLTSVGGYSGDDENGAKLFQQVDGAKMREDLYAAAVYLKNRPDCTGKLGAIGFCFGGGVVNRMATDNASLLAAIPYYGAQPPADKVPAIKAALLLQYAENDENIDKGIPAYEAALKANNKKYTIHIYPGTQHAFNNDTGAARYNKAASDLAWERTLAFFKEHLGAPPRSA